MTLQPPRWLCQQEAWFPVIKPGQNSEGFSDLAISKLAIAACLLAGNQRSILPSSHGSGPRHEGVSLQSMLHVQVFSSPCGRCVRIRHEYVSASQCKSSKAYLSVGKL
jgi:hypothetical protein